MCPYTAIYAQPAFARCFERAAAERIAMISQKKTKKLIVGRTTYKHTHKHTHTHTHTHNAERAAAEGSR
jgi:hypothetical protein